jgi:hypothetical protein
MEFRQSLVQTVLGAIGGAIASGLLTTWGVVNIVEHERPGAYGMLAAATGAIVGGISAFPSSKTTMGLRISIAGGSVLGVFLLVAGFLVTQDWRFLGSDLGLHRLLLVVFISFQVAAICGVLIGIFIINTPEP